ncbi:MAG: dihydrolipoyl dehydrogenase family protein [Alphaproteobacteria bacterium]
MSGEILTPDLCVIGAGSGGLSVAAGAAQMGADVVLIERHKMGGDCLNYGCVPSKALIAAAHKAHGQTDGAAFGVAPVVPKVDYAKVMQHVHEVIETIAPIDSVERFEGLGCTVIQDSAKFVNAKEVEAGGKIIRPRRFVIATGSGPIVPPIPGLESVPYWTNETLFDHDNRPGELPTHLIVVGGGPIGLEMAAAHRRLGSKVTVLEGARALPKDDPELAEILLTQLRGEGVDIREGALVTAVAKTENGIEVSLRDGGVVEGSHLLLAVGRKPAIESLNLEAAGIDYDKGGIKVNAGLRTSNRKAYAIGDVAQIDGKPSPQFTHVAGYHAGIVIRSALFRAPAKVAMNAIPWVTYTDPELAQVGLTEAEAKTQGITTRIVTWELSENDRAQAERRTEGMVKVVCTPKGKVLGAGIVGPHAGELIAPWVMAETWPSGFW